MRIVSRVCDGLAAPDPALLDRAWEAAQAGRADAHRRCA